MNLVFLGLPGAGKGTQAALLAEEFDIPHISTGDMFREAVKQETELGKKAKEYMDAGDLVPDQVTIGIVRERLAQDDCRRGFILDGFPRTITQAEALEEVLQELNRELDLALLIDAPEEELVERLTGRRVCQNCGATYHVKFDPPEVEGICDECGGRLEQRDDDKSETVKKRLEVNREKTEKMVNFYSSRGILTEIDARGEIEDIQDKIIRLIEDGLNDN